MSFSQSLGWNWSGGGESLSGSVSKSDSGQVGAISLSVPNPSTNLQVDWALDVSQLKILFIKSDQDVTLKTNSTSAPDDTIALKAGVPLVWESTNGYYACPITADVTTLYVTNASGAAAQLDIRGLTDSTP